MLLSFKPDSSAKRVDILKEVINLDPSDIEGYVKGMMHIQKQLRDIDLNAEHYETKAPAHMTRLLENLGDDRNSIPQEREVGESRERNKERCVFNG